MVKKISLILCFSLFLYGDIYNKACVECHKNLPVDMEKLFFNYLLKYSSERSVKGNLISYLKTPSKEKSVMSESFIERFGIKKAIKLNDKELKEAIDIYWEKYKVFGRLE